MARRTRGITSAQLVATTTSSPDAFPAEVILRGFATFEFESEEPDRLRRLAVQFGTPRQVLKTIHAEQRLGPSSNQFTFDYAVKVPRPDDYVCEVLVDGVEVAAASLTIPPI
ncbi:MAG: hypothetical protein KGJ86_16710 [Chloroflexota bacterium]|nr:hypothetical protein [Chloroflexota bacterium]